MRIVLEGCDGTGKTTLAKILAEKYELDICHCTASDPADYEFYSQTMRKDNVIWDRHTIGELIYPKIFDRQQKIYTEDARILIHHAKEAGAKIFVLTADMATIYERLNERGNEDSRIYENVDYIDKQFRFYAEQFHVPIIDTSKLTLKEIFNLVEEKEKIS